MSCELVPKYRRVESNLAMENNGRGRSRNAVSRSLYAFSGLAFYLTRLSFAVGVLGLGSVLLKVDIEVKTLLLIIGCSFSLTACSGLFLFSNRRKVTCPLCRVSLFSGHKSLVKRRAKRVFGSAKVPIATSVVLGHKVLSCPYCNERVKLARDDK